MGRAACAKKPRESSTESKKEGRGTELSHFSDDIRSMLCDTFAWAFRSTVFPLRRSRTSTLCFRVRVFHMFCISLAIRSLRIGFWPTCGLVLGFLFFMQATPAHAQFRNNGLQFNTGWIAMGTTTDGINRNFGQTWGATDQVTLGVGYFRAMGYQLFWDNQTAVGFGGATNLGTAAKTVVSLNVSTGLRYNLLDERHRPFVSGHFHYVQMMNTEGTTVQGNAALGGAAFWVGARVGGGYEWFFDEEMSLMGELNGVVFANLDQNPKLSAIARLSWNVYF